MEDIQNRIDEYRVKAETAVQKQLSDYETLRDMEIEYCALINEGNAIRMYLVQHPDLIDRGSYLFLSNQIQNADALDKKYDCLRLVIFLGKKLFDEYRKYVVIQLENNEFEEAVNIYQALFRMSQNHIFRKQMADIYFRNLNDIQNALEIYKDIENKIPPTGEYYNTFADMYAQLNNNAEENRCRKLAKEFELKEAEAKYIQNGEYKKAIEILETLFLETRNFTYKLEIANIHAVFNKDMDLAIKLYKEVEPEYQNDKDYWYKISELYQQKKNYFRQVLCMQKAIEIELQSTKESGEAV